MAGVNEAQRGDRMELPKDSDVQIKTVFFGWSKRSLRCASFTPVITKK
jgi:hypothetical protein